METTLRSSSVPVSSVYRVASLTALVLIGFFLLMKLVNLITVLELRFVNVLFVLYGDRYVVLHYRAEHGGNLEYLNGMMIGFMTALTTAVIFSAFIFVYLNIDSGFMHYLQLTQPFGSYLKPSSAALVTLLEGAASGAIISFMLMHTLNKDGDQG